MKKSAPPELSVPKPSLVKQPQAWSPDEKLAIVLEAATLTEGELGVYLRSKGVHAAMIDEWRAQALGGLRGGEHASKIQIESREVRALRRELARKDKALAETAALLVLKKKSWRSGGRGRRYRPEERQVIRMLVEEAVASGARLERACMAIGLRARTLQRWSGRDEDGRHGPRHTPANALTTAQRAAIIAVATCPEFRDMSPKQIVPKLADLDCYRGSESTFYRVLRAAQLQKRRGRARTPTARPRAHIATGPWQVASWDITYLRSHTRGLLFYLYVVIDVWSRKILGWAVHEVESAENAQSGSRSARPRARTPREQWAHAAIALPRLATYEPPCPSTSSPGSRRSTHAISFGRRLVFTGLPLRQPLISAAPRIRRVGSTT